MNDAHFHLTVNHLPIIIPGIALLVILGGFIFKSEIVKRTAYFLFIIGALSTFVAFSSGEGAEEVVEHMGADHHLIHEHEEMAETFALFSHALGLLSLVGLWANWKRKKFSNIIAIIVIFVSAAALYCGRATGTTGGEIMHTEIRNDNGGAPSSATEEKHEEHDDH
ncbi:hypothetical protein HYN59_16890 [Flavobacterium album]|uniref:DUF2231 domain-containing protein n=1 Tax=Flavobacterium album TaxID=2175091 RepID=A0A2S1R232_9FLAO|nr:hypothetical protein [Flavobacterium album]AWH86677.1 hypothetical protein HYN59_16890 [Flavobacterium album]